MSQIFLIISVLLLLVYFIGNIVQILKTNKEVERKYKLSKIKVSQDLIQKKESFEKEMTDEIYEKLESVRVAMQQEIDQAKEDRDKTLELINKNFEEESEYYKDHYQKAEEQRRHRNEEKLVLEQNELNQKLDKLREDYKDKKDSLDKDFFAYSERIISQRETLNKEIQAYEQKQKEIISRFKAEEEVRQRTDFYRIQLKESDKEDIQRLRRVAETLNSPTILYKLIWENYYKNPFSQMIGRVVPAGSKCGIYKITNIENNKVYIGQTKQDFGKRWRDHVRRGVKAEPTTRNKLYEAMWEVGPESFTFEIITTCKPEELNEKEKYFISYYQSNLYGYNGTKGNS